MRRFAAGIAQFLERNFGGAREKAVAGGLKSDAKRPRPKKIPAAAVSSI
jgi:hypothetical protein